LLLSSEIDGEEREYVETIRSSGDILISTINDILDFSKIEGGKMELESQPFDLVECIEASLDLVSQAAAKKGLRLSYLVESKVPRMIVGDLTRLRQILVNLLSNAVKFTEAGTISVTVSARAYGNMYEIRFQVKDTGIGISPDRMDRLFHSFSQGDASTTRKYGGTGLGLAISKRLAELMGGAVHAESEPGVGSTFHFTILAEIVPDPLSKELQGKRLLLASKDKRLSETLCVHLDSSSLKPEIAGSAKVALEMISERRFDLLILDSNLEGREELMEMIEAQAFEAIVVQMPLDGESTSFAVSMPIVPSALGEEIRKVLCKMPLQRTIPMHAACLAPAKGADLRILLAEDNVVNQKVALRMLERLGYRADAVANGLEVLQALDRMPYEVVLMDVQMPDMDGLEATKKIRTLPQKRQPYIIAMTAHAMKGDREECLQAGMNDYVSKPVRIEELQGALERSRLDAIGFGLVDSDHLSQTADGK